MRRTLGTGETVIPATFELVYMIGWAPGADQPAALERGTATTSLTDVLVR
jgi:NADH dehydrogenase [ubiquinone] 1 alpha subcomplex assembly factor 5